MSDINPYIVVDSIEQLQKYFNFSQEFKIIEKNLDEVRFVEDINSRRRLDAEVLSLISANIEPGKMLDIGTFMGHSAARMAVNSPESQIFTVNIHPDELKSGGKRVTGAPSVDEIGAFYREHKLTNVQQIFANTKTWQIPDEINELSLVYVDGCHDREFVYNDTKLVIDRVKAGGFVLWHDCTPVYRSNFEWIDNSMQAIDQLIKENLIQGYVLNVKNSWIGIWQKQKA